MMAPAHRRGLAARRMLGAVANQIRRRAEKVNFDPTLIGYSTSAGSVLPRVLCAGLQES